MTLGQALAGKEIPEEIRNQLTLVTVPYFSFAHMKGEGQLVVHTALADDVAEIFQKLFDMQFPIKKMIPVVAYGWDDDISMADNNTSAFNYRVIAGTTTVSQHAYGRAIDINPVENPYVGIDGSVMPQGAVYDTNVPGTITAEIAGLFISHGWEWGGNWGDRKDWQHFQKSA